MSKTLHVKDASNARHAADKSSMEWHVQNIPCTKTGGASCRLLDHRRGLNRILLEACLELREDRRGQSRGDALIAVVEAASCGYVLLGVDEDLLKSKPLDLVERLLAEHRCITAIEFNASSKQRRSLLSAVKRNCSLKSVTICGTFIGADDAAFMCEVIKSCSHLESLAFKVHDFEKEYTVNTRLFGRSLDLDWHHLTALDVAKLSISAREASSLIRALTGNKTITDLRVGESVFGYRDEASNALFASYLAKEGSTLQKLTLKSSVYYDGELLLRELINVFCNMNTLEELNADITVKNRELFGQDGVTRSCSVHRAEALAGESIDKNSALADILETTRRNASAVFAAAQFVLGQEDGVEGARSIELMHDHPRLLEMVSEGADVTKAAAKEMISSALLRVGLLSLDEFMRMTGVVKQKTQCFAHPGARRQLSDLNLDCWLHIRRFLKIADVLQPRADLCENCR
nr:uncharacterized protein LOC126525890 isoform X3 [Dermacentor andersoni]